MHWKWQVQKVLLLLFTIIGFGVTGLMLIEGWSFIDALYMTVITMSTVGYKEIHPLSSHGKIFVIILIIFGVGSFFYIITSSAEYIIAGHLKGVLGRKKMKKDINAMKGHFIICGFGRVGEQVALELVKEGMPFVVIDNNPNSIQKCISRGYLYIEGDASNDDILREAGISKARGLVSVTDSDADNVYVTLSAKGVCNDIFVVARATLEGAEHKLRMAGADRVISPYSIGGRRLANLLLRPAVVEFLDVVMHSEDIELLMEEVSVHKKTSFVGTTMGEANIKSVTGTNILAIRKKDDRQMIPNPSTETLIEEGDLLIALGTREQLKELEKLT